MSGEYDWGEKYTVEGWEYVEKLREYLLEWLDKEYDNIWWVGF